MFVQRGHFCDGDEALCLILIRDYRQNCIFQFVIGYFVMDTVVNKHVHVIIYHMLQKENVQRPIVSRKKAVANADGEIYKCADSVIFRTLSVIFTRVLHFAHVLRCSVL